jgi:uncharacterized membrane protein
MLAGRFAQRREETIMSNDKCSVCNQTFNELELISGHGIRHEIENIIRKDFPEWSDYSKICKKDYSVFRDRYISSIIEEERGEIQELEIDVIKSIKENEFITENINTAAIEKLKVGEIVSDKVAAFGGSWRFIIIFFIILFMWILVNSITLLKKPFDPYPFILMNLILSCIAAIQAPIIMMSQNRQEKKDRIRSENDYKVNLKAEIEIRTLHEKVDHLLLDQWARMMKIQELQIEMLEEIRSQSSKI